MSERVVVPPEMLKAMRPTGYDRDVIEDILEAALLWLSEHPIVPTHEQTIELCKAYESTAGNYCGSIRDVIRKWQEIAFDPSEPEVPEAVKDLLWDTAHIARYQLSVMDITVAINRTIIEAYRRGLRGKPVVP